jgi:hypothetical protein
VSGTRDDSSRQWRKLFVMLSTGYSGTDYTFLFVSNRPVVRIQNLVSEFFVIIPHYTCVLTNLCRHNNVHVHLSLLFIFT